MPRIRKYHKGGKAGHTTHPNNLAYADHEPYDVVEGVETPVADPALAALIAQRKLDAEESARKHGAITQGYQDIPPNAMWMYNAMNNMPPAIAERYRSENPGASPEGINMWGLLGAAGYKGLGITIPGTKHIMGGVTLGDALNAYFLKEGVEGGIKHIPEFMEDPSLEGARNIAWDAIYALPGIAALKRNVLSPFLKGFKNARATASTGKAQNMVWDATTKSYVPEGELSGALQQLTGEQQLALPKGKKPKAKKKKYEPSNPYEESNVAVSIPKSKIPVQDEIKELIEKVNPSIIQGPMYKDLQKRIHEGRADLDSQIQWVKWWIKKLEGDFNSSTVSQQNSPIGKSIGQQIDRNKEIIEKALQIKADHTKTTLNPGVYQYPSFMTGSKLEKQVSPKDGTIARSVLEQLVKNKNTKTSEAIAVKDVLGEFEGKRIPYENFKQSLALDIRSAEIISTTNLQSYANTGVRSLGYEVGVPNVRTGKLEGGVTPKTNLYKDASLGLTKQGEGHFPDQPHSFWIRSMSTAEEPNVLKALEWQTDVESLKDPSKGLLVSEEASNYSNLFEASDYSNLDHQINTFKEEMRLITNVYPFIGQKGVVVGEGILPKEIADSFTMLKKGLQIALDYKKEAIKRLKANSKGLPLKFVNESLLDAARQGKEYLDVPTAETVFTIEGWDKPNNAELDVSLTDQYNILERYDRTLSRVSEFAIDAIERREDGIRSIIDMYRGADTFIKSQAKEIEGVYDGMIARTERWGSTASAVFEALNYVRQAKNSDLEDMYWNLRKQMSREADNQDPSFKASLSTFQKNLAKPKPGVMSSYSYSQETIDLKEKFIAYIKNLKSEVGIKAKQDITKFKEAQKKIDEIKAKGFDLSKISESEMSVTKNYRNFPKLWRSEFGTDVKQVTDPKGNSWMRVKIPENFYQNDISLPPSEIKTYKQGGALKGLMKKYGGGGSVGGWGAQGNFTTEYTSRQPEVEELPNSNALAQDNTFNAEIEAEEPNLTPEEEKAAKRKKALQSAGKGALMGAKFGPWGALAGGVIGGAIGWFAKQGMKIKKLMPSYQEGGELAPPEKKPDVKDLIYQLESYGKETRNPKELWELMDSLRRKPHGSWNMPPDEEGWVPRHDDIYKYLASRGIDIKDDEIAKAYIMPGSVAGAGFVDGYDASAYSEKGRYVDPTKPSDPDLMNTGEFGAPPFTNARGQRIMLASTQLKNPTTRIEEAIHSLQQQRFLDPSVSDSKIGGNKRRLYRMLKKQPWLKELSPDIEKTITKGNYALKGRGSTAEFEAKLIASKMAMIQEGVLPKDGKVSDKDLEAIKQWYENYQNKTGETLWESVLFQDFSDKEYRDEILKTLNKL